MNTVGETGEEIIQKMEELLGQLRQNKNLSVCDLYNIIISYVQVLPDAVNELDTLMSKNR